MRGWMLIAALCLLGGCGAVQWRKPGFTQVDFNRDLAQCDIMASPTENVQQPVRALSGLGMGLTDAEKFCLRDKGWVP